jgi:hypothetical protein
MTFPSFTSGEVLRAQDMNAVGMWLVKTQTIGTGVSSVTVTGAFSADYDNYLISYSGGSSSTNGPLKLQLGSVTAGYYGNLIYGLTGSTSVSAVNDNNTTSFTHIGSLGGSFTSAQINVLNAFATARTSVSGLGVSYGTVNGSYNGYLDSATSFTAFTLIPGSGTMTGGTIRVYGYRN